MRKVDPERHGERRREILDAAVRCFVRNGFHGSSIANLCAEAGMSPGHLYHYFPSKEAIVEAMVAANLASAASRFAEAVSGRSSVLDVIVTQLYHDASSDVRRAPLLFDMLAEAGRSASISEILQRHSRGMEALLADLLRRGQQTREIDQSLDPEVTAAVLIALADGLKGLPLRDPNMPPDRSRAVLRTLLERFLVSRC